MVSGTVKSLYSAPSGIFGSGWESVCVTIWSGGAALGKLGDDLGTKRTVLARAMVFVVSAWDVPKLGMGFMSGR